ncbi:chrysanthemyl diphosphate synthase [Tanacetum coccineum]|uniref:Chrysanthemyl diphosphate synthase n=1 Tax=Tanacetum coccineum TaxID=301880 RepID=A0ABQ5GN89_9ASTR
MKEQAEQNCRNLAYKGLHKTKYPTLEASDQFVKKKDRVLLESKAVQCTNPGLTQKVEANIQRNTAMRSKKDLGPCDDATEKRTGTTKGVRSLSETNWLFGKNLPKQILKDQTEHEEPDEDIKKEDVGDEPVENIVSRSQTLEAKPSPICQGLRNSSTDVMVMAHPAQNINHSAFRSMFEWEKLSGNNFNDWFSQLKLVLRVEKKMYVIEQPIPPAPAANSAANVLAEWNAVYDTHNEELRSMFEKQAGVERFDLIQTFHACKQEEGKLVSQYILQMKGYVEKLERLGYVLLQDLSVGLILNGLTSGFAGFVRNYNMRNMGKTIGELHALLIEYEKGLSKKAATQQVMAIQGGIIQKANKKSQNVKGKGKGKGKGKVKSYIPKPKNPKHNAKEHPAKNDACHHCKEVGHCKRNCPVYLAELMKSKKQVGTASSSGIFTIELHSFPNRSWVYDTGCGTHICITKQCLRGARKLKQGDLYLYVGNGVRAQVEAIRSFDLVLPNGLVICLDNCQYAPSIIRGVVSVSRLAENGFVQCITDYGISISRNNVLYFNAIPSNGIYEIDMSNSVPNVNSIYNVSNKRVKHNLDYTYLWHCRLAHISKKRIEKLQHDGLLKSTDDESFDQCVYGLSGKMTRKPFLHHPERASDILGLIHIDVCGPLRHVSRKYASYFITFTDDYSRHGYIYLLKHKHEVFETFKVFKNEVENQLGKTIKALRSDRGGEYISQEFKDYLKACGIVQQLTPPYTPQHNRVSERRNRTLLDMVRSMMNLTTLPLSFWDYALESAARILNMVPTKKVDKTPYELWFRKVPNLSYLKMQSMKDNQVWRLVNLCPNGKTVGSKWLFKKKTNMDGNVHTYKARLLAKRFTQTYGVDYEETFSSVDDIRAIRILIAIAAGAVDWKSSKQSTTAMSATEDEYIAASEAAMEAV